MLSSRLYQVPVHKSPDTAQTPRLGRMVPGNVWPVQPQKWIATVGVAWMCRLFVFEKGKVKILILKCNAPGITKVSLKKYFFCIDVFDT